MYDKTHHNIVISLQLIKINEKKIPGLTSPVFCSFSRQVGIRNGMFFGQAKQLCPSLQAVPYDFHAYKEVARTMYETLARYVRHAHCSVP